MPKVSQEHIEKRKAEILEAAKRVFKRKGFEPTTMQDVVEESGMSRGGVYQYFSSTEEMIQALHASIVEDLPKRLERLLADKETVWEVLEAYLRDYEESDDEGNGFGIVMFEYSVVSWRNEQRRQFMLENGLKIQKQLAALLQIGVGRGEFQPQQPLEAIVSLMSNVTDGLILHSSMADPKIMYLKEQMEGLKIYLRTVLQVREAGDEK